MLSVQGRVGRVMVGREPVVGVCSLVGVLAWASGWGMLETALTASEARLGVSHYHMPNDPVSAFKAAPGAP